MTTLKSSPEAAKRLTDDIASGELTVFSPEADDRMGDTDCPEGCAVEPDGHCFHGYQSAALTAGLI